MEHLTNCIICNTESIKNIYTCTDYVASKAEFYICQCNNCGFKFTNPRPAENETGRYYDTKNYASHFDSDKNLVAFLYRLFRIINSKIKLSVLGKYANKKGILLDYGCGLGFFLNYAKKNGWKTEGTDISQTASQTVLTRYNIKTFPIEKISQKKENYSCITLWHVYEHVYNPQQLAQYFFNALQEKGILILGLPNHKSFDAKYYKKFWDGYDVPRHIWHFSQENIIELMRNNGFNHIATTGMPFDSFYISIRSEKNKNSHFAFITGLIIGFISLVKAIFNKEYSSNIYVFKKVNE